jgi:hypothetical protein
MRGTTLFLLQKVASADSVKLIRWPDNGGSQPALLAPDA